MNQSISLVSPINIVPPCLESSPLLAKGGFAVYEGLMSEAAYKSLQQEAFDQLAQAKPYCLEISEPKERGGLPARKFMSATAGPQSTHFYQHPWVRNFLQELIGCSVQPTGPQGTFTYYTSEGDYLDLHRDIISCDLALITVLHDNTNESSLGGTLCLYPDRIHESLANIDASKEEGAVYVRVKPGQSVVLLGGIVPHRVVPMKADEERIISVLCFRAEP